MRCSDCETLNETGRRYCCACGHSLVAACAQCSFANGRADRFCGGCGRQLAEISAAAGPTRLAHPGPAARPPLPLKAPERATDKASAKGPGPRLVEALSAAELGELFQSPAPREAPAPTGKISQDELDKLFG